MNSILNKDENTSTTFTTKTTKVIRRLINVARERFGDELADYIERHPERWNQWVSEYQGLADWMRKDGPQAAALADKLAARAVVSWAAFTLSLLDGPTYRKGLRTLWTALRENTDGRIQ